MASPTSPSTSPAAAGTSVGLSGTFSINGVPVTVNSGDFSKLKSQGIVFTLTDPVPLGKLDDLINWFNTNFGTDIPKEEDIANQLPTTPVNLQSSFSSIFGGTMVLTALQINTNAGFYKLAFSYTLTTPLHILGDFLEFDSLGLSITRTGAASTTSP